VNKFLNEFVDIVVKLKEHLVFFHLSVVVHWRTSKSIERKMCLYKLRNRMSECDNMSIIISELLICESLKVIMNLIDISCSIYVMND